MSDEVDPRLGQIVDGRYKILEELGRGGMGCVYRAEHTGIRKAVALKLLAPRVGTCGPADRARFEREAFATGRLKHPNCVAVTDFGSLQDGTLYLAMELLEGRTLASALEDHSAFPLGRALHIARHILEGLVHAHELGIVHRDLKPQNVMLVEHLGDHDFAKVLDFGLAKLLGDTEVAEGGGKLTAAGITFGTPHYISPEQAFGNPVDHRADLYAVSVMLFEMVSGQLPFDGPDIRSILMQHATRVVPRLSEVAPEISVPGEVELILRQGMAKDPRDRPQTARDYIEQLQACLDTLEREPTARLRTATPVPGVAVAPTAVATSPSSPAAAPAPAPVAGAAARQVAPGDAAPSSETTPLVIATSGAVASPSPALAQDALGALAPASRTRRRPPWILLAVLGGGALVALVAVLTQSGGQTTEATPEALTTSLPVAAQPAPAAGPAEPGAPSAPEPAGALAAPISDELAAAIDRATAGSSRDAEKALKSLRQKHPNAAAVAYALGRVYFDRPWPPEAIKAYRVAIKLDPAYRSDELIIKSAIRLLSSHSSRGSASRFLERDVGAPALPALQAVATGHSNKKVRRRAAAIVAKLRAR